MKFPIVELVSGKQNETESLGTKEKLWFDNNELLWKKARLNTGEAWAEKIAACLCEELGIVHATYDLALWNNEQGIVTQNLVPPKEKLKLEQILGNVVLFNYYDDYPEIKLNDTKKKITEHTIERIFNYFVKEKIAPPKNVHPDELDACDYFCGYLMLDTLISNQDRHHENWAVIANKETGTRYLCPTYDHGSSLGRELTDNERKERLVTKDKNRQITEFVKKARSMLYLHDNSTTRVLTLEAFQEATKGRNKAKQFWLAKLKSLSEEKINFIVNQIPITFMTDIAKQFTIQLILENKRRILEAFDENGG